MCCTLNSQVNFVENIKFIFLNNVISLHNDSIEPSMENTLTINKLHAADVIICVKKKMNNKCFTFYTYFYYRNYMKKFLK